MRPTLSLEGILIKFGLGFKTVLELVCLTVTLSPSAKLGHRSLPVSVPLKTSLSHRSTALVAGQYNIVAVVQRKVTNAS